jgi:ribosomal protein L25 (general stress protein Ctc)
VKVEQCQDDDNVSILQSAFLEALSALSTSLEHQFLPSCAEVEFDVKVRTFHLHAILNTIQHYSIILCDI